MINPVFDREFLRALDQSHEKEVYAKIISLDFTTESPRESIMGRITNGTINIDGNSSTRRTCSLSMVALEDDIILTDQYWVLKNKFKVEIGLKNKINPIYPDIIWFKQGIFVITNFSYSQSTSNISISISGSDKMCLLDGKMGGHFPSKIDLATIEEANGVLTKIPIYDIIQNLMLHYGQERLENIIINDLEQNGYQLWEYRGNNPMYMIYDTLKKVVINLQFDGKAKFNGERLDTIPKYYSLNTLDVNYNDDATKIDNRYAVVKIEYGQTAGYYATKLVYSEKELIVNAGASVTSALDKIKSMLGNFEYFYDLDGKFVFQKQNNYLQELFTPFKGDIAQPSMIFTAYEYEFDNEELIVSFNTSPTILKARNDFSIWGSRKGSSGTEIPIHGRYAIHKKPDYYKSLPWVSNSGKKYPSITYTTEDYDWREIIYNMALDYYRHNQENDFLEKVENANGNRYIGGITGYEPFYEDMQGFWRQLYNPDIVEEYLKARGKIDTTITDEDPMTYNGFYIQGPDKYWNEQIHTSPESLLFWIDFLDSRGELSNFSINKIGRRSKSLNDNKLTSIYYPNTPEVLFVPVGEKVENYSTSYVRQNISEAQKSLFSMAETSNSITNKINQEIYDTIGQADGVSLTTIPIYYLNPNTRIKILGEDYIMTKISYSLTYNTTMSLTCTKVKEYVM